jgi:hypothetical protein
LTPSHSIAFVNSSAPARITMKLTGSSTTVLLMRHTPGRGEASEVARRPIQADRFRGQGRCRA